MTRAIKFVFAFFSCVIAACIVITILQAVMPTKLHTIVDISTLEVRKGKSIFFHETTFKSGICEKLVIKAREACAVESAAKMNPNLDVYLIYSSPAVFNFKGTESDRIFWKLLEYNNIKIVHLNKETYARDTPLENLWNTSDIGRDECASSFASNVFKYITMFKYGGIYLELDVMVLKNLEGLGANFAVLESDSLVAASVLGFDYQGDGHKHAEKCLLDVELLTGLFNIDSFHWRISTQGIITSVMMDLCGVQEFNEIRNMAGKVCEGFKVYPVKTFFPIRLCDWRKYFRPENINDLPRLENASYTTRLSQFGALSKFKISKNAKTLYTTLAERQCPKVFKEVDKYL